MAVNYLTGALAEYNMVGLEDDPRKHLSQIDAILIACFHIRHREASQKATNTSRHSGCLHSDGTQYQAFLQLNTLRRLPHRAAVRTQLLLSHTSSGLVYSQSLQLLTFPSTAAALAAWAPITCGFISTPAFSNIALELALLQV